MKKILKVNDFPQGKGYVPGVRVAGDYLKDLGFTKNEPVRMTAKRNIIILTNDNVIDPHFIDLFIHMIEPKTVNQ